MTVMTEEWAHELKVGPGRRLRKVKAALGIKPGQGYRVCFLGTYWMLDDKPYYVYEIHHIDDKDHVYGLRHYALLDLDTEEYRAAISDEALMMMSKKLHRYYFAD